MLTKIKEDIIDGNRKGVVADVQKALDSGIKAEEVLNEAMIPAMARSSRRLPRRGFATR